MDGITDGWMNVGKDGWMEGQTNEQTELTKTIYPFGILHMLGV